MAHEVTVVRARRAHSLEELARRASGPLAAAGAERAVVFGSWARGTADGYSDLDLVVVLTTALPRLERGALLGELVAALPVGVDLLVFTPEEWARGMELRRGVFDVVSREGITIYARGEG